MKNLPIFLLLLNLGSLGVSTQDSGIAPVPIPQADATPIPEAVRVSASRNLGKSTSAGYDPEHPESCPKEILLFPEYKCDLIRRGGKAIHFSGYSIYRAAKSAGPEKADILNYELLVKPLPTPDGRAAAKYNIELLQKIKKHIIWSEFEFRVTDDSIAIMTEAEYFTPLIEYYAKEPKMFTYMAKVTLLRDLLDGVLAVHEKESVVAELRLEALVMFSPGKYHYTDLDQSQKMNTIMHDVGDFHVWEPKRFLKALNPPLEFTPLTDFYSFGLLAFRLFHDLQYPFSGDTREQYGQSVLEGNYLIKAGTPRKIAYLIWGCMQEKPEDRFDGKTIRELLDLSTIEDPEDVLKEDLKATTKTPIDPVAFADIPELQVKNFGTPDEIRRVQEAINDRDSAIPPFFRRNPWGKGLVISAGVLIIAGVIFLLMKCTKKEDTAVGEGKDGQTPQADGARANDTPTEAELKATLVPA